MKDTLKLTEYRLRAMRRPLLAILLLMGPAEFLVMLFDMHWLRNAPNATLDFYFSTARWVLLLCMVAAILANFMATIRENGRSHFITTLMLLPTKRSALYLSGVLSGLFAVWAVIAAQAIWFLLLYAPVGWCSNLQSQASAGSAFLTNGLFLSMVRVPEMQIILPRTLSGFVFLLGMLLAPIASLQAVAYCKGIVSVICSLLAGCNTVISLMMQHDAIERVWVLHPVKMKLLFFGQVLIAFLVMVWAIYNLNHSKNL